MVWVLLCGESVPQKTSVSFTCKPQCAVKRQDGSHRDPGDAGNLAQRDERGFLKHGIKKST